MGDPFAPPRKPRRWACMDITLKEVLSMILYAGTLVVTFFLSKAANDITYSANQISRANLKPFLHYETNSYSVNGLRLAIKNSGAGPAVLTDFGFGVRGAQPASLLRLPENDAAAKAAAGQRKKKSGRKAKGGVNVEDVRCEHTVHPRPANVLIEFEEELARGNISESVAGRVIGNGDRVVLIDVQLSRISTEIQQKVVFDNIQNPSDGSRLEEKAVPSEFHMIQWRNFSECIRAQLNDMNVWVEYENALGDETNRVQTTLKFPSLDDDLYRGLLAT